MNWPITVKLFNFVAINFAFCRWHVALINFRISLACPISYNGSIKFSWQFIFAMISASGISRKYIAREIK